MIELLLAASIITSTPKTNSAIVTLQKQQTVQIVQAEPTTPPEPTLEEKIKNNYYKCDLATQWIWAQDASCHTKQSDVQPEPTKASVGAQKRSQGAPAGWYPKGQCTYWVWSKRPVGQWNDASQWKWQAARDGWTVSKTPVVGAIAWEYNHVALVESINGDKVTVSEMNFVGWNRVSQRTLPVSHFWYIY